MPDWEAIRRSYAAGEESPAELARAFGVPRSTLYARARRENWQRGGGNSKAGVIADAPSTLERLTGKLIARMEQAIDDETMDSRDIKTMAGALRELSELVRQESGEAGGSGGGLEVCFIGEAEELSR